MKDFYFIYLDYKSMNELFKQLINEIKLKSMKFNLELEFILMINLLKANSNQLDKYIYANTKVHHKSYVLVLSNMIAELEYQCI